MGRQPLPPGGGSKMFQVEFGHGMLTWDVMTGDSLPAGFVFCLQGRGGRGWAEETSGHGLEESGENKNCRTSDGWWRLEHGFYMYSIYIYIWLVVN